MFVWSGWGFMVPVIVLAALFPCMVAAGVLGLPENLGVALGWMLSGIVSGVVVLFVSWNIEQSGKPRVFVDRRPHQYIVMRPTAGSLFCIPTRTWGAILPLCGAMMGMVALLGWL